MGGQDIWQHIVMEDNELTAGTMTSQMAAWPFWLKGGVLLRMSLILRSPTVGQLLSLESVKAHAVLTVFAAVASLIFTVWLCGFVTGSCSSARTTHQQRDCAVHSAPAPPPLEEGSSPPVKPLREGPKPRTATPKRRNGPHHGRASRNGTLR